MSVFENVLVAAQQGGAARRREAYELTARVLSETGLDRAPNLPAGRLGLLQRKRLELARALATRPRLLLLDEVAGGLTDPEVEELIEIVRTARMTHGLAVVWIEHVVRALVETVDRLICLAGGTIIGDGTPREVLEMQSVKEIFLGVSADTDLDADVLAGSLHLGSTS
jgi:branched-chain amino acid transport system ATP-binding protein